MGGYTGTPRVVPGRTGLYQDAPGYPQAHRATPGALDTTPLQGWAWGIIDVRYALLRGHRALRDVRHTPPFQGYLFSK